MADNDDPVDAAMRLEQALDRIAQHMHRPPPTPPGAEAAAADTAQIAARLDALIAHLRAALGTGPAD